MRQGEAPVVRKGFARDKIDGDERLPAHLLHGTAENVGKRDGNATQANGLV